MTDEDPINEVQRQSLIHFADMIEKNVTPAITAMREAKTVGDGRRAIALIDAMIAALMES